MTNSPGELVIRKARVEDQAAAYLICLKTGDYGNDGEPFYTDDPDALGRLFVGPYLAFEPDLSLVLEDREGVCGYALAALDSRLFYARYEQVWRPKLCARFPEPKEDPASWTRVQQIHYVYHHPDYFSPEPYELYPSHLHIDLLPRAQGRGAGRKMIQRLLELLRAKASPGVHLGLSLYNTRAYGFYQRLGFHELARAGTGPDACIYMGLRIGKEAPNQPEAA